VVPEVNIIPAGNIGSAFATILAKRCGRLLLVGRRGSESRLDSAHKTCLEAASSVERTLDVRQATSLEDIKDYDIVVIATNSPNTRLLSPSDVTPGSIVISASVPSNLCEQFEQAPDSTVVFDGGYARLPVGNEINFLGMPGNGLAYGCLAETIMIALEGDTESFAKGRLSRDQILRTLELAERYGFQLGEFRLGQVISWQIESTRNQSAASP
jgi:fatty aldehyde-generating acyl-ACP reductase